MTNLRMWRRLHSGNIIAEVTAVSGIGGWAACVWRLSGDPHRIEAARHFALPSDAHRAADQLAAFTFQHRCDTKCRQWDAVEHSINEDQEGPQRPKSIKTPVDRRPKNQGFRQGDIIVTAVAHHYSIGRIQSDGRTQKHLASEKSQTLALVLACKFGSGTHRVFLFKSPGDSNFEPLDCQEIRSPAGRRAKTSTLRRGSGARNSAADGSAPAAPMTAPKMRKRDRRVR